MGIVYRSWQFWQALLAAPSANDLQLVRSILPPEMMQLFELMQPDEQMHCIKTARFLLKKGHNHADLLTAALLHDVGKINHPLQLWERVWLVIGNTFFPKLTTRWCREYDLDAFKHETLCRVFVVHERHAGWGADMAQQAGVSQLSANLIRRHQDRFTQKTNSIEDQLLSCLQEADNLS